MRLQRQLAAYKLLIIDVLGYEPLSPTGVELLFEVFSQRYERGSMFFMVRKLLRWHNAFAFSWPGRIERRFAVGCNFAFIGCRFSGIRQVARTG